MGVNNAFIGIYGHPAPDDLAPEISSRQVSATWTNQAIHFASSYFARTALWLPFL